MLDGTVQSAPSVANDVSPVTGISGGSAVITLGGSDDQESAASNLSVVLRYGSLRSHSEQSSVESISATLGSDSLWAGLIAGLGGLLLVAVAMILYYRALGLINVIGLSVFGSLMMVIFSALGAWQGVTLTLAGVAGVIVAVRDHCGLLRRVLRTHQGRGSSGSSRCVRQSTTPLPGQSARSPRLTPCRLRVPYSCSFSPNGVKGFALHFSSRRCATSGRLLHETSGRAARPDPSGRWRALLDPGHPVANGGQRMSLWRDPHHGRHPLRLLWTSQEMVCRLRNDRCGVVAGSYFSDSDLESTSAAAPLSNSETPTVSRWPGRAVVDGSGVGSSKVQQVGGTGIRVQTAQLSLVDEDRLVSSLADLLGEGSGRRHPAVGRPHLRGPGHRVGGSRLDRVPSRDCPVHVVAPRVENGWCCVGRLGNDLIFTAGIYAVVGFEVTPATVIAILTILGYSLYDTVVVFDKIQENVQERGDRHTYGAIVNMSMNQVLMRSITSLVTLLPIGSLLFVGSYLLGVTTLREFALALFIGVATGTYSSIFLAAPFSACGKSARITGSRCGTASNGGLLKSLPPTNSLAPTPRPRPPSWPPQEQRPGHRRTGSGGDSRKPDSGYRIPDSGSLILGCSP